MRETVYHALLISVLGASSVQASGTWPAVVPEESPGWASDNVSIAVERRNSELRIIFEGILEAADSVSGPWRELQHATSPFLTDQTAPQTFYRVRRLESIFASRMILSLTITGAFQQHFDLAFAGIPDGIFPPVRDKPYFGGTVQVENGPPIPVTLRVRGNSSLQECPFPKLKFKVSPKDRAGTPFYDAREVKVGTHCAEGGTGSIGRLRDERAAFRETLAYEAMEMLGFVAPRVRRARIEYRDTSPEIGGGDTAWQVSRNAMILDHVEVVAKRLGGRALEDAEIAALTDAGFDEQRIAELRLLHALLGNWDYTLSADGRELWNTEVIALADGELVPVAGDFDLTSWVTETVQLSAPHDYLPDLPDLERQARYEVGRIREQTPPAIYAAAMNRFAGQQEALEALIATADVDAQGRANALRHVSAFFDALAMN